jgi:hypothetical protein
MMQVANEATQCQTIDVPKASHHDPSSRSPPRNATTSLTWTMPFRDLSVTLDMHLSAS